MYFEDYTVVGALVESGVGKRKGGSFLIAMAEKCANPPFFLILLQAKRTNCPGTEVGQHLLPLFQLLWSLLG